MKEQLLQLVKRINNISTYYEMSDSPKVWEKNEREKKQVDIEIKKLPKSQKTLISKQLDTKGKQNAERYFRGLFN